MKILIVDDSRAMRRLYCDVLSGLVEVTIVEAEDGVQAVYELEAHNFEVDLILLDWMMPRMDGLTLLRHMKSNDNLRKIPIIMVTGCSEEAHIQKAIRNGADGYLLKPFTEELFLQSVVALRPVQDDEGEVGDEPSTASKGESLSFLNELTAEMQGRILNMSCLVEHEAGQTILNAGEAVKDFFFVATGQVEEQQPNPGCGSIVRTYGPGECFGVTELMAGDPLRSICKARVASTVGRLPRVVFEGMLVKFPEISVTLSRCLAYKARDLEMHGDGEGSELAGSLEVLDLPSLVQAINLRQKTCVIELPEMDSQIAFVRGQVFAVNHPEYSGPEAFFHIMDTSPSSFRLVVKPVNMTRNVDISTTRLLLQWAKTQDEETQLST